MMEKYYRFAGVDIAVAIPREWMYREDRSLAPFRTEQAEHPHRFTFEIVDALPAPEGKLLAAAPNFLVYSRETAQVRYIGSVARGWEDAYLRAEHLGKHHRVQLRRQTYTAGIGTHTVLEALAAEHLVARNSGFVFHCAYISRNGRAILFTAPSGTGKSTQAELWRKHRGAKILNGDRAVIRLQEGRLYACGIPFAGSSDYCENVTLPIEAIVYLSQAPVTGIRKLRGYEAFQKIWEGVSVNTWDREDMEQVSAAAQQAAQLPVYHLACTPDESAVLALERELGRLVNP